MRDDRFGAGNVSVWFRAGTDRSGQIGNQLIDRSGAIEKPDKTQSDRIVQKDKAVSEIGE